MGMSVVGCIVESWLICVSIVKSDLCLNTLPLHVSNVLLFVRTVRNLRGMTKVWLMMSCVMIVVFF